MTSLHKHKKAFNMQFQFSFAAEYFTCCYCGISFFVFILPSTDSYSTIYMAASPECVHSKGNLKLILAF